MIVQTPRTSRHVAFALALALSAAVGWGQVRQVYNGEVLDANPQIGSGGSNRPVPGFVPVSGNDIITGNVTGLKYFHGSVPYRSPYEFRGSLGSASLNDYARQSAIGGTFQGTYTGQTQTYYLPSRTVSSQAGQLTPAPLAGGSTSGFDSALVGAAAVNPTSSLRSQAAVSAALVAAPLGADVPPPRLFETLSTTTPLGLTLTNEASPLFGLQRLQSVPPQGIDRTGATPPGLDNPQSPNAPQDVGSQSRLDVQPRGVDGGAPRDGGALAANRGGSAVDARIDARVTGPAVPAAPEIAAPQQGTPTRVNDTYAALLNNLRQRNGGQIERAGGGAVEIDPGTGRLRPMGEVQTTDPTLPNWRPRSVVEAQERALKDDLRVLQAGRDMQPLKSFAGKEGSRTNALLAQAEKELNAGEYIDAAKTYQRVISLEPENALAVVGRAHAQLAAGMYESAAYDLKFLWDRKPALMAVRYDLNSFIPEKRLKFLIEDLEGLAAKSTPNNAAFLLAYVYYQTGQKDELQQTLNAWSKRQDKAEWPALMKKAWIEQAAPATRPQQ